LKSHKICFCCLLEGPDFGLMCGHAICSNCVRLVGQEVQQEHVYRLKFCPLCRQGSQNKDYWAEIKLKPAQAGVRVLAIDGGGVRGTFSVRILQSLEREIGLGLPLYHFFDVIFGTSSGKQNSIHSITNKALMSPIQVVSFRLRWVETSGMPRSAQRSSRSLPKSPLSSAGWLVSRFSDGGSAGYLTVSTRKSHWKKHLKTLLVERLPCLIFLAL
jgi:hypothetical protein